MTLEQPNEDIGYYGENYCIIEDADRENGYQGLKQLKQKNQNKKNVTIIF